MRLANKVAIITGSGSGIGKATALRFGEEGAHVIVNDVNPEQGQQTVQEIRGKGGSATFFEADVTIPESVQALADYVK